MLNILVIFAGVHELMKQTWLMRHAMPSYNDDKMKLNEGKCMAEVM